MILGLIMIFVTNAPDALTSWKTVIRRRFQPTIKTLGLTTVRDHRFSSGR
jgi:hypothetical protein